MDEQSKAALDLLVQNGYLEAVKGKYRPTKKLNEVTPAVVLITVQGQPYSGTWENLYTKFIVDCKVPKKSENGTGDLYDINKYSEDAMKKFTELMKAGISYDVLVKVVSTYYRAGANRYKKTISNYIIDGLWRMDYEMMKNQTESQQQQTLNEQLNSAKPFTRDRIG